MSAWLRPALLLWVPLVLAACDPRGATATPTRAGAPPAAAGLGVPFPMADPVKTEGWSRAALSRAAFAVIVTADSEAPFQRPAGLAAPEGPMMLGTIIEADVDTSAYDRLAQLAFSGRVPLQPASVTVDRDALTRIGHEPPARSVFLVGPDGNCRAVADTAVVHAYRGEEPVLQIDWTLTGCDDDQAWSPVGVIADRFAEDTRWVPATLALDTTFERDVGWQGPLASMLPSPQWPDLQTDAVEIVRIFEIAGTAPRLVQVYDSVVQPAQDSDRDSYVTRGLDPACADIHATRIAHGWWDGAIFDAFSPGQAEQEPHLLGAMVRGDQVDALVYDQRRSALVSVPPAPTMDGDTGWVERKLPTASHSRYVLDSWGYLPTSPTSPLGDPCVPDV